MQRGVILVAFCSAAFLAMAAGINTDYITPPFTFSPDQRYGVMIPIFHDESNDPDNRLNKVVELATEQVVAVIHAESGYDRVELPRDRSTALVCRFDQFVVQDFHLGSRKQW